MTPTDSPDGRPLASLPVDVVARTRSSARMPYNVIEPTIERLERAVRIAGFSKHFLERERTTRDVRGVFEQPDVASGDIRGGKANDLPKRVVPRHHGQDRTERFVDSLDRRTRWTGTCPRRDTQASPE